MRTVVNVSASELASRRGLAERARLRAVLIRRRGIGDALAATVAAARV